MPLKCCFVIKQVIKNCIIFPPFPFHSVSIPQMGIRASLPNTALFPRVNSAESGCGVVEGGLGSTLAGFSPNTEISF